MDPESKKVSRRHDSDVAEGVQHEKIDVPSDDTLGATADRQLEYVMSALIERAMGKLVIREDGSAS